MQQTFLGYVTTDLRFWLSSVAAILRSIAVPFALVGAAFWYGFGEGALVATFGAALVFTLVDWCLLVVRMARRVALGLETPNDFLDRSVLGNARYLHRSYYVGPMPSLDTVRG